MTASDEWAGAQLKALRISKGMTQQQLADATSLDRSVVIKLEGGKRPISDYYAGILGRALKVKPKGLLPPPAEPRAKKQKSPLARLAEVEEGMNRLGPALTALTARVAALENQGPPKTRRDGSQGDLP